MDVATGAVNLHRHWSRGSPPLVILMGRPFLLDQEGRLGRGVRESTYWRRNRWI